MNKYVTGATTSNDVSKRELLHKEVSYEAALEGIVLLENDGTLPLKSKRVALYGAGGRYTIKGGTGSGEVNERHVTSIYEGLINAGFKITNHSWWDDYEREVEISKKDYAKKMKFNLLKLSQIINAIGRPYQYPVGRDISDHDIKESACDTAIYVVARQAGEGGDKKLDQGEFDLTNAELKHLSTLSNQYKHTILVINSGAMMDLTPIDSLGLSAVVYYCQQGMEGGRAFANLLGGKVSPSGKLSDTWVNHYHDIPYADQYSYLSGNTNQEYYHEGIYVGYRYFDTYKVQPRYPFGFGLTYSKFTHHYLDTLLDKTTVTLSLSVENIGQYEAKEVIQLYVSLPYGKLFKEKQRLIAFKKSKTLKKGENETLEIKFDLDYLKSYDDENSTYIIEKGIYTLLLGSDSQTTIPVSRLHVNETIVISKHSPICSRELPIEELRMFLNIPDPTLPNIKTIQIDAQHISSIEHEYRTPPIYQDVSVDAIMQNLTTKEMIDICVGDGILGMFNGKKIVTMGAVGRTTDRLFSKGLVNVNLCDGPSGLRVLRRGAIRGKTIKLDDYLMDFMRFFPKFLLRFLSVNKDKDILLYQYATSFPVATSLAQTWNTDLIEKVGQAISIEMAELNVTYWLAPAMNIHRNPLCGRNFEYYSEDPVLTGKMASALTRGVQSVEGHYVTIKHFACNNQEDNRNRSNSNVNERALREIYLRGFEICVKEAKPKAVMTSYNLVNGVYTPNSYDLVTKVLRNEWGFDGVVMTDWYSTGKGLAKNDLAIKVGNDMIMPGTRQAKKEINQALKCGIISKTHLYRATANIVRQILLSQVSKKYPPQSFE